MNLNRLILFVTLCICFGATTYDAPPQAIISNGAVTAHLYLPDAENGYYRGTRFDWSGQISSLTYKGHTYFGKWFKKYEPTLHDAIMGPVEAFDPVGYDEAATGGRFIKIGVGALQKPAEDNYFFANSYTLLNGGKWSITKKPDEITFTQALNDSMYSYTYTKKVKLARNKPELTLSHSLKNTGKTVIETNVMNHNFFVIDSMTTGSDFTVNFPFEITDAKAEKASAASTQGKQILLESGDPAGKLFFLEDIKGYAANASDYNITVNHEKSGTGVNIRSDRPFEKLNFWASVKTICPEPYIHIRVEPGQTFSWNIMYQFKAK